MVMDILRCPSSRRGPVSTSFDLRSGQHPAAKGCVHVQRLEPVAGECVGVLADQLPVLALQIQEFPGAQFA